MFKALKKLTFVLVNGEVNKKLIGLLYKKYHLNKEKSLWLMNADCVSSLRK